MIVTPRIYWGGESAANQSERGRKRRKLAPQTNAHLGRLRIRKTKTTKAKNGAV